ncbi:hypothetical protein L596_015135 [Steinernema carpocapsae]|uniref:Uncharacterized protein n=1 Tax=Steinernema carpocapsae TaxID=34508 RepID=A0A4U5NE22_STECR|nr:hypothetical protein L596_015135 [Steinernema carpocapsae]
MARLRNLGIYVILESFLRCENSRLRYALQKWPLKAPERTRRDKTSSICQPVNMLEHPGRSVLCWPPNTAFQVGQNLGVRRTHLLIAMFADVCYSCLRLPSDDKNDRSDRNRGTCSLQNRLTRFGVSTGRPLSFDSYRISHRP